MPLCKGWWVRRLAIVCLVAGVGCGSSPAASTDAGAADAYVPTPIPALYDTMALGEVAFYQTVKVTLMKDGSRPAPYNAPLIETRKGIARVFLNVIAENKKFKSRTLEAELHVFGPGGTEKVLKDKKVISRGSSEDDLTSTFNFPYDESFLSVTDQYYVVVRDPAAVAKGSDGAQIRYPDLASVDQPPQEAVDPLAVALNPGRVRVRIVPIAYGADMSNRLPDTSDAQVKATVEELYDMYPTNQIDLDVRSAPMPWAQAVDPNGNGWMELLQAVMDLRAADAPPSDMYYVGAFQPRASFPAYCQQGCIAGLAATADPAIPAERAVIVLGYGGQYPTETVAHELGHTMGRHHSPCGGAQGTDPKYPYMDGASGVTGFRQSDQSFIFDSTDVMGYCQPIWISDFTYKALADRVRTVNQLGSIHGSNPFVPHKVQRIYVGSGGALSWGKDLTMTDVVGGNDVEVIYRDASGGAVAKRTGHRYGYDHLPGGFVLVENPPNTTWTSATIPSVTPSVLAR